MQSIMLKRLTNTILLISLFLFLDILLRCILIIGWNYIISVDINKLFFSESELSFTKGLFISYFIQSLIFIKDNFKNQLDSVINKQEE
jgi:hypothetical protein